MKITIAIIFTLFTLIFLSACAFKEKKASEIETLASNYGGIYIFDKKIREEILENERKKGEAMKKMSLGDDFWDQLKVIEKKFPQ
ncbi:TPA: hypothetical protein RZH69_001362, partial [Campylobacter coli]|nr:hypothetical protein [Campylobacter coli]